MKVWKYSEMQQKVLTDLSLQGQTMVKPDELVGYFNEAFTEAETEIHALNQEYFLTKYYIPLAVGVGAYAMPQNIYLNKIRGVEYQNGSIYYHVKQFRRKEKFINTILTDNFGPADDYRYLITHHIPGQYQFELHPASRDAAVVPPVPNTLAMTMWYYRECVRVPTIGEYCNGEVFAPSQVTTGTSSIQTYAGSTQYGILSQGQPGAYPGSIAYITGDQVQFSPGPGGTLPAPLVAGVIYFIVAQGSNVIKLATTALNAAAGTTITLTTTGTIFFTMTVASTVAIQAASLIDIPEFSTFVMQWVKCRCYEKNTDPRLDAAMATLLQQRKNMVDSMSVAIVDDDDQVEPDFSSYQEHS
jgi:hypothetical protein